MSVNDKAPSMDIAPSQRANQLSLADLDNLNLRLKRLSENVLPHHPYLLTLPTKLPFKPSQGVSSNWAVGHGRPFHFGEEELQYMTFLTHNDSDSLLKAVGDWSDESGYRMADRSSAPITTEPPKDSIVKRKISLNDYKNQQSSGSHPNVHDQKVRADRYLSTREPSQQIPKHSTVNKKTENKTEPQPPPPPPPIRAPKPNPHLSPDKGPKKRPSTSDLESLHSASNKGQEMHSSKKRRLSPEREFRKEPSPTKLNSPKLPALLSPTLPPTNPGPRLPRLLSPTLPPDIEKELARLGDRSPTRHSSNDSTSSKQKREETTHARAPVSVNGGASKESNHELIVRLRYGRTNRKRVEGLLKFAGKKKLHRAESPVGHETDHDAGSTQAERRRRELALRGNESSDRARPKPKQDDGPSVSSSGRSKETKASERPPPPRAHPPSNDKPKHTSLTPVKDSKASLPRRTDLGEGEGRTPVNQTTKRPSVDSGIKGSPSQPDNRSRNIDRRAWRDEFLKFSNIGRELKHAAVRYNSKTDSSPTDDKLAAVTAIEAIMAFILAFVADDQSKLQTRQAGDSSTWQSILAYWRVVKKNSTAYPALHGLCLLLGAVSYEAIHSLDLERLAVSPLPGEHTPVPTPGSDGNTVLSDENKKNRKEFLELKNRLPECWKESQRSWLEGARTLSEDILRKEFPNTWSSRSHNHSERGRSTPKPGDYPSDYFLPLGFASSPIEVVRFGSSLLQEWTSHERVEWKARLGLA
ncbi:hypothetical protein N7493_001389 [Penicillium malachiteum]|uniref:Ell binding protein Ebp1 C-terminal domain-containing protein n=1 Tax=Penicillium malachiteum TaxID=1324776 RepID=A0AAD6HUN1_9EURO|nr:hypothetical protein N7493_001389 [Penicillium malachiteum]